MIDCASCPLQKRAMFLPFTAEEIAFMRAFKTGEMTFQPGETLLAQGERSERLFTVLEGLGHPVDPAGGRTLARWSTSSFPAIGLQAGIMGEMRHSVQATSPMRVCVFQRSRLWDLFRDKPGPGL